MQRDELAAWLRLTQASGVGSGAARRLLAAWGLPQNIFAQNESAWQRCVSAAQARTLASPPPELAALVERTWQWLRAPAAEGEPARAIVTLGDAAYPQALLATQDPPPLLYLLGAARFVHAAQGAFAPPGCLAMVGSRNPTAQGAENARQFARALREAGLCIVSGLALGIDAAAHEGALDAAPNPATAATIAVAGTGLDQVYPRANRELARRIAQGGLLISEFPLGTPPLPGNFPKRNRIIAGLSQGTLVVEAAPASGSLITARLAAEQGREVFAIPGSIHAPQSRGCHALLRQGAKLVETAQDVLEELRLPSPTPAPPPAPDGAPPPPPGDPVLRALGFDPLGLDALTARTGMDAATLQVRLLELELAGQVARLPGGLFQRVGIA
jgi:DNA processing protein